MSPAVHTHFANSPLQDTVNAYKCLYRHTAKYKQAMWQCMPDTCSHEIMYHPDEGSNFSSNWLGVHLQTGMVALAGIVLLHTNITEWVDTTTLLFLAKLTLGPAHTSK